MNVESECATSLLPFYFSLCNPFTASPKARSHLPCRDWPIFWQKRVFLFGVHEHSSFFLCLFGRGLPLLYSTTLVGMFAYFPFVCIKERERSHYKKGERELPRQFSICPPPPSFSCAERERVKKGGMGNWKGIPTCLLC